MENNNKELEKQLLKRAQDWFYDAYPRTEATELEKLRIFSKQGLIVGKKEHGIKIAYYKRMGYWDDGKTTLKEKEKELRLKKIEFGKQISLLQNSYVSNLDEIINNIKVKKEEIEKIPQIIKKEYGVERNKLLFTLGEELTELKENILDKIKEESSKLYNTIIIEFNDKREDIEAKTINAFELLHFDKKEKMINTINSLGVELETELSILDYSKKDEDLIEDYDNEVKKINQEIMGLRSDEGVLKAPRVKPVKKIEVKIDTIFSCPYCVRKPFVNKGGMGAHIKAKHPERFEEYKTLIPKLEEVKTV